VGSIFFWPFYGAHHLVAEFVFLSLPFVKEYALLGSRGWGRRLTGIGYECWV